MRHLHRGFTLIELMVVIVILGVLVAIALPSFQNTIRRNRVAAATNELVASLNLARSEALRNNRGEAITQVCRTNNASTCSSNANWHTGWLVQSNETGSTVPASADFETAHRTVGSKAGVTIIPNVNTPLVYGLRGITAGRVFTISPAPCPSGKKMQRIVTVLSSGQVTTTEGTCP